MKVSCLTPTFNRAPDYLHLLGEAVESFRRQELPSGVEAELVVLNDTPGQTLECPIDGVRIVNSPQRYASLGEKLNALCDFADGEILLRWDDDDISLPFRIAQSVDYMRSGINYFNPQRSWFLDANGLHSDHSHGYCHIASAFTRTAWRQAGRYPHTCGIEDAILDRRLRACSFINEPLCHRRFWQYVYRWSVSPRHLSGIAGGPADDPHLPHYQRIGQEEIEKGNFIVIPVWKRDYAAMCKRACE